MVRQDEGCWHRPHLPLLLRPVSRPIALDGMCHVHLDRARGTAGAVGVMGDPVGKCTSRPPAPIGEGPPFARGCWVSDPRPLLDPPSLSSGMIWLAVSHTYRFARMSRSWCPIMSLRPRASRARGASVGQRPPAPARGVILTRRLTAMPAFPCFPALQVELCFFSQIKIHPGHGKRYSRADGQSAL